jgi:hypothetical protein
MYIALPPLAITLYKTLDHCNLYSCHASMRECFVDIGALRGIHIGTGSTPWTIYPNAHHLYMTILRRRCFVINAQDLHFQRSGRLRLLRESPGCLLRFYRFAPYSLARPLSRRYSSHSNGDYHFFPDVIDPGFSRRGGSWSGVALPATVRTPARVLD